MASGQLSLGLQLRDEATFAGFVAGRNAALLQTLERLSDVPGGWTQQVVHVWGRGSCGRSHLLQAACWTLQERGESALYLPLAELQSLSPAVLQDLDHAQLVALDDLHCIVGRPEWEAALFSLFRRVQEADMGLLMAADAAPRQLPVQLPDLHSRLMLALVYHLQPLTEGEQLLVLQIRARSLGLQLGEEVGRFLLSRSERSTGALFGLLTQLDQASLAAQRRLTIPFVKSVLGW